MLYEKNITIEEMFLEYEETGKFMGWSELVSNVIEYNEMDYNKDTIMKIANDYIDELIEIGSRDYNKKIFMVKCLERDYLDFYDMDCLDVVLDGVKPSEILEMCLNSYDFDIGAFYFYFDDVYNNGIHSFNDLEDFNDEYATLNDFLNKLQDDYTEFVELWEQEDEAILEMVRDDEIGNVYLY